MKIISFDVGIKNMAYCIFDISKNPLEIPEWKVVSLIGEEETHVLCTCKKTKPKKKQSQQDEPCGKEAKYAINEIFLCDKHAKTSQYLLPQPRFKTVKKMNIEELLGIIKEFGIFDPPKKKGQLVDVINTYLKEHMLVPISYKKLNAGAADMVSLGQSIKTIFSKVIQEHPEIGVVLIENQISPIANRMKTIQGMLAQFFIMIFENIQVEFISSSNKLKMFSVKKDNKLENKVNEEDKTQGQKYKEHKKDGVFYCEQLLKDGKYLDGELWTTCEKKKKDDLADCFLQGVWWLNKIK